MSDNLTENNTVAPGAKKRSGVRIASALIRHRAAAARKAVKEAEVPVQADPVAMSDKKKILFVASECTPFIQTGGLAEVIGSLSKALAATGKFDVRVVIPMYSDIKWEFKQQFNYIGNIYVPLAWRNQYCGIFTYEKDGVTFYFLDYALYKLLSRHNALPRLAGCACGNLP